MAHSVWEDKYMLHVCVYATGELIATLYLLSNVTSRILPYDNYMMTGYNPIWRLKNQDVMIMQ